MYAISSVPATSRLGETPLIHAARQGHLHTVKYLLDHGADPSVASSLGATALLHAAGIGKSRPLPMQHFFFLFAIPINHQIMHLLIEQETRSSWSFYSPRELISNQKVMPVLPLYGLLVMDRKVQSNFCFNIMLRYWFIWFFFVTPSTS